MQGTDWIAVTHQQGEIHDNGDLSHLVFIAFKLPGKEDLGAFENSLRTAGLVGGKFMFWPRALADPFWEDHKRGLGLAESGRRER